MTCKAHHQLMRKKDCQTCPKFSEGDGSFAGGVQKSNLKRQAKTLNQERVTAFTTFIIFGTQLPGVCELLCLRRTNLQMKFC